MYLQEMNLNYELIEEISDLIDKDVERSFFKNPKISG